jgi:hypothetical protein
MFPSEEKTVYIFNRASYLKQNDWFHELCMKYTSGVSLYNMISLQREESLRLILLRKLWKLAVPK